VNSNGTTSTQLTVHFGWIGSVAYLAYATLLLVRSAHNGQTFGKQIAGIAVLRDDGFPLGVRTALIREAIGRAIVPGLLVFLVAPLALLLAVYLLIDYVTPIFEPENRALHDLLAGTHVVRRASVKHFTPATPAG
jgi:uncharacterized RDD family membrane protein YckC